MRSRAWKVLSALIFLALADIGLARDCIPRHDYDAARTWVRAKLACERHETPHSSWIAWADYCPAGGLGFFILKVKTGAAKEYLFERMPPDVWAGFQAAPSPGRYYHQAIKGDRFRFRLGGSGCE